MGEQGVVALDRHHRLPRLHRGRPRAAPATSISGAQLVDPPAVRAEAARALAEDRDRLVDSAEERVLALEDLHEHARMAVLGLEQRPGVGEVGVGVVAVADLVDRQAEDLGGSGARAWGYAHRASGDESRRRPSGRARPCRARRGSRRTRRRVGPPAQQERDRRVSDDEGDDRRHHHRHAPGSPSSPILRSSNSPASTTAGTESRNEYRAAAVRLKPRNRPAVIVAPERETPGTSAAPGRSPRPRRRARLIVSIVSRGRPSRRAGAPGRARSAWSRSGTASGRRSRSGPEGQPEDPDRDRSEVMYQPIRASSLLAAPGRAGRRAPRVAIRERSARK